jgi:hypothetical protein
MPTVAQASPPPTRLPTLSPGEGAGLARAGTQAAAENAPGASIAAGIRDSQKIGMGILPALREGRWADAAAMWGESTIAALSGLAPGSKLLHTLPVFGGVVQAYHGSPHLFDEFRLEKIGTGEGAQAYGHGLYFAESEGVAKSYRDSLAEEGTTVGGKPLDTSDPEHLAAAYLQMHGGDRQAALDLVKADAAEAALVPHLYKPGELEAYKKAPGILESGAPLPDVKEGGALYRVKLDVNHEDLLDYDKPLSQQPEPVRQKLSGLAAYLEGRDPDSYALRDIRSGKAPGSTFYHNLTSDLSKDLDRSDPALASEMLHATGIPGIRYLDAGSRGSGDGTRNVVMFDPSLIKIEQVNGQPAPSAAEKAAASLDILSHSAAWDKPR